MYLHSNFLSINTLKNGPQKLIIIGPDPFISQSSPDHSPKPRIDFSYYEISRPDICSLICDLDLSSFRCHLEEPKFLWINKKWPIENNMKKNYFKFAIKIKFLTFVKYRSCWCKTKNLSTNYIDTTIIWSVQFKNHGIEIIFRIDFFSTC